VTWRDWTLHLSHVRSHYQDLATKSWPKKINRPQIQNLAARNTAIDSMEGRMSATIDPARSHPDVAAQARQGRERCTHRAAHPGDGQRARWGEPRGGGAVGRVDRQTLRDWVIRYNEHGLDGLADRPRVGRRAHSHRLAGPDPEASGPSAFTREDLVRICKQRFAKSLHVTSTGRILHELRLSRQKARPSHPEKDPAAQAAFKKSPGTAQKNSVYA
jgi:transposase